MDPRKRKLTQSVEDPIGKTYVDQKLTKKTYEWDREMRATWLAALPDLTNDRLDHTSVGELQKMLYNLNGINWAGGTWAQAFINLIDLFDDTGKAYLYYFKRNSVDAGTVITDTDVNVTTVATHTLTVAAGHAYKVRLVSGKNATRASSWALVYTPSGGTAANLLSTSGATGITQVAIFLGGAYSGIAAGMPVANPGSGEFWMQAGDTLALTSLSFVAADVMRHYFVYEDYTL